MDISCGKSITIAEKKLLTQLEAFINAISALFYELSEKNCLNGCTDMNSHRILIINTPLER